MHLNHVVLNVQQSKDFLLDRLTAKDRISMAEDNRFESIVFD